MFCLQEREITDRIWWTWVFTIKLPVEIKTIIFKSSVLFPDQENLVEKTNFLAKKQICGKDKKMKESRVFVPVPEKFKKSNKFEKSTKLTQTFSIFKVPNFLHVFFSSMSPECYPGFLQKEF
jgi:hypothetical protein